MVDIFITWAEECKQTFKQEGKKGGGVDGALVWNDLIDSKYLLMMTLMNKVGNQQLSLITLVRMVSAVSPEHYCRTKNLLQPFLRALSSQSPQGTYLKLSSRISASMNAKITY